MNIVFNFAKMRLYAVKGLHHVKLLILFNVLCITSNNHFVIVAFTWPLGKKSLCYILIWVLRRLNIILVSRPQLTCWWSMGEQKSARLGNVPCPGHSNMSVATGCNRNSSVWLYMYFIVLSSNVYFIHYDIRYIIINIKHMIYIIQQHTGLHMNAIQFPWMTHI